MTLSIRWGGTPEPVQAPPAVVRLSPTLRVQTSRRGASEQSKQTVLRAGSTKPTRTDSAQAEQLVHGQLVRGGERVLVELRAGHPFERVYVLLHGLATGEFALVQV